MSPIIGMSIAAIVIAFCAILSPSQKPKPKTAKDDLDAAMQKYLKELNKK